MLGSSPSKTALPLAKRQSTVNGLQSGAVKRNLNGVAVSGSALPRVSPRLGGGRPDMAAAAAMASLVSVHSHIGVYGVVHANPRGIIRKPDETPNVHIPKH